MGRLHRLSLCTHAADRRHPGFGDVSVTVLDKLTCAGNLVNLPPVSSVYRATSSGQTTWFGLAREVFALLTAYPPDLPKP